MFYLCIFFCYRILIPIIAHSSATSPPSRAIWALSPNVCGLRSYDISVVAASAKPFSINSTGVMLSRNSLCANP